MALFVGIDVAKDKFDACGIGEEGEKIFSLTAAMDRKGFEKLAFHLRGNHSLLLGLESTACYHITLFSYLTAKGYRVVIINPLSRAMVYPHYRAMRAKVIPHFVPP